jgi:diphthine-ammonia ligase
LGRELNGPAADELAVLAQTKRVNAAGEGGEYETFVVDAPLFTKRIAVTKGHVDWARDSGTLVIDEARLVPRKRPAP